MRNYRITVITTDGKTEDKDFQTDDFFKWLKVNIFRDPSMLIEVAHLPNSRNVMLVDEEGLLKGLKPNGVASGLYGHIVVGIAVTTYGGNLQ